MPKGGSEHLGPLSSGDICPLQRRRLIDPVALGTASQGWGEGMRARAYWGRGGLRRD